jgi:hypothetical protein
MKLPKQFDKHLNNWFKKVESIERQKRFLKEFSLIYFEFKRYGLLKRLTYEHQFYLIQCTLNIALKSKITTIKKHSLNLKGFYLG